MPSKASIEAQRTERQANEAALLDALANLGGQRVKQDSLKFHGTEFIVPKTMGIDDAIEFLREWREAQAAEMVYTKTFRYRPHDGAHALNSALIKIFGTAGISKPVWSFFEGRLPDQISIPTGVDTSVQVPWGDVRIPMLDGVLHIGAQRHKEYGNLFHLRVTAPKMFAAHVEGLFVAVEDELKHYSIYRGKAIDGQPDPEFVDLRGVDPNQVIYADEVMAQLEANVWSLIQYTDIQRKLGLPLKRAVLVHGPFGTGKTLAGYRTGQIAGENGWTFIYCRPTKDNIGYVMSTARLYQPCVVFVEDVDTLASGVEGADPVTQMLDILDGINAKGTEIMLVLTTNYADRIHKGMLRPGRLDSVIEIGALDVHGMQRMVENIVPQKMIDADGLDYEAMHDAMEGYLPAFVREVIDRAIRYALVRNEGERPTSLETEDFVLAAKGLRPQWERMNGAGEGGGAPTLDDQFRDMVANVINDTAVVEPTDPEAAFALKVVEDNNHTD